MVGRPRVKNEHPAWFDAARYEASLTMDAAGWYLNLALRSKVKLAKHSDQSGTWPSVLRELIRLQATVVPLSTHENTTLWLSMSLGFSFCARSPVAEPTLMQKAMNAAGVSELEPLPQDVVELLQGRPPACKVQSLTVNDMYFFESLLPEDVRKAGRTATYPPGMLWRPVEGKRAALDDHIEPQRMGRFVRVSINAPEEVLIADFRRWLAEERQRVGALASGPVPFAETLRELQTTMKSRHAQRLAQLGKLAVLPVIDLDDWRAETKASMTDEYMAQLVGLDTDRLREARRYAAVMLRPFAAEAWFAPLLGGSNTA